MFLTPGSTAYAAFGVTGVNGASDADALPTIVTLRNGVPDGAVTATVTHLATGSYSSSIPIPDTYSNGDFVQIERHVTINGLVLAPVVILEIQIVPVEVVPVPYTPTAYGAAPITTVDNVLNMAKTFLAQATDTLIGALPDGMTQNVYTIASDDQMVAWLNEGMARLARLCVPVPDLATMSGLGSGAVSLGPYTAFVSAAGRTLHRPDVLVVNGRQLKQANVGFLNSAASGNFYPPTPTGDPTAWADSNSYAKLSSYTSNPTFSFTGYFLPLRLKYAQSDWGLATVAGATLTCHSGITAITPTPVIGDQLYLTGGSVTTGVYTVLSINSATEVTLTTSPGDSSANVNVSSPLDPYFDDYSIRTAAYYVAWMLAQKNMDVNVLMGRIAPCLGEFVGGVKEIYTRLISNDQSISSFFTPTPVDAMVNIVEQFRPRL